MPSENTSKNDIDLEANPLRARSVAYDVLMGICKSEVPAVLKLRAAELLLNATDPGVGFEEWVGEGIDRYEGDS